MAPPRTIGSAVSARGRVLDILQRAAEFWIFPLRALELNTPFFYALLVGQMYKVNY